MPSEYTLRPDAEMDIARVQELRALWCAQLDRHRPDCLLIDLSAVTFIDSSGLSLILAMHKRQQQAGGGVAVVNPPRFIRKLLAITAIDQVIELRKRGAVPGD